MHIDPYIDQNPRFQAWFQGSTLTTPQGSPLVVYHGTRLKFSVFHQGDEGIHVGSRKAATDRLNATGGKKILMPLYVRLRNPLRVPDLGMWGFWVVLRELRDQRVISEEVAEIAGETFVNTSDAQGWRVLHQALAAAGYDGFVYANEVEGCSRGKPRDSWVVFRPEQLKAAAGNCGAFDPSNPDIYH